MWDVDEGVWALLKRSPSVRTIFRAKKKELADGVEEHDLAVFCDGLEIKLGGTRLNPDDQGV